MVVYVCGYGGGLRGLISVEVGWVGRKEGVVVGGGVSVDGEGGEALGGVCV